MSTNEKCTLVWSEWYKSNKRVYTGSLWCIISAKQQIWSIVYRYGVATMSRLLKIIGLFCKRVLLQRPNCAKETCNWKEPTNHSHPIDTIHHLANLSKALDLIPSLSIHQNKDLHINERNQQEISQSNHLVKISNHCKTPMSKVLRPFFLIKAVKM